MEKVYLTVNEASKKTGVSVHTLRYWEKVFDGILVPLRTKGNQRRYSPKDVEIIFSIKKLLKDDLYSTAGARKILKKEKGKKNSHKIN